jgi:hypothetical protein
MDARLIERAKRYSERSGKSVSQMVADYFALIEMDEDEEDVPGTALTPRVRALIGSLKGASATEDDYRRYLEEKHR